MKCAKRKKRPRGLEPIRTVSENGSVPLPKFWSKARQTIIVTRARIRENTVKKIQSNVPARMCFFF